MVSLPAQRRFLYIASVLCIVGSIVVLFSALGTRTPENPANLAAGMALPRSRSEALRVDRATLIALCQVDLLRPLHDSPPPEAPKPPPSPAPPAFGGQLVATMMESRSPQALIRVGRQSRLLGVGDIIEGATLVEVQDGMARLQIGQQVVTLTVKQSSSPTKQFP